MPASSGRPFCEYADEGHVLCARRAESVYARPAGSLMLERLRDFFFVRCRARWDGKKRWKDTTCMGKSGNGRMSSRLYFNATDKT